ncbi:hypothetical protein [Colwellia piezophila]|uniref:hypothetical protein n=1 Tax=Colwellia piezophila TaxID=211668 RepID=UPI00035DA48A|nr:hypothetical protein [Colwellia piezophila]
MSKRVTTKDFINKAREKHGNKYDYSKVKYLAAIKKVTIICPEHGEFEQTPANHASTGHGCHECGGNKPLSIGKFIERAKNFHHCQYDYSRVKFKNVESKVEIICPEHGSFLQRVMSHLRGFGCDECGREEVAQKLSFTQEEFLSKAKEAHGGVYDYSLANYQNAQSNIKIICSTHGVFEQNPYNHILGFGCSKCSDIVAGVKRRKSLEEFKTQAVAIHGDSYDYSKVNYETSSVKVEIVCKKHGHFLQSPSNHIGTNQAGCPGCAISGFDQTKSGILYYIAVNKDDGGILYKIGITNLTIHRRFSSKDLARIRVIKEWEFKVGLEAKKHETEILQQFLHEKYYGPNVLIGAGNTELFTRDILELDCTASGSPVDVIDVNANLLHRPTQLTLGIE